MGWWAGRIGILFLPYLIIGHAFYGANNKTVGWKGGSHPSSHAVQAFCGISRLPHPSAVRSYTGSYVPRNPRYKSPYVHPCTCMQIVDGNTDNHQSEKPISRVWPKKLPTQPKHRIGMRGDDKESEPWPSSSRRILPRTSMASLVPCGS